MPYSPRRVTLIAGSGSLVLFLFAVTVGRKEIATQYHLFRIRRDPTYFRSILNEPEGTPRRAAVRKYLESDDGKSALIRECLPPSRAMRLAGFTPEQMPRVTVYMNRQQVKLDANGRGEFWHDRREPEWLEWLELAHEYVDSGYTFTVPEHKEMQFELRRVRDTRAIAPEEKATGQTKTP